MNCSECRQQLTAYLEELLDQRRHREVADHLQSCSACQAEAEEQRLLRDRLLAGGQALTDASLEAAVMDRIAGRRAAETRRIAMRQRYGQWGMGLAAAAALAAVLFVPWGGPYSPQATAAEVLAQAVQALSDLHSVYLKVNMRTVPGDNFGVIGLDYDFVTVELWKRFGDPPQWRAENQGRIVVMDGQTGLCLVGRDRAYKFDFAPSFGAWVGSLMDVDRVLDSELHLQGSSLSLTYEDGADGRRKLVVTVEAQAQGDFTNDWLKDKYISASDNRRVYRFDAETNRLEDLEVWVHGQQGDVLVLEIAEIIYNLDLDPDLFVLDLPEDVIWWTEPQILPDNEKYARMSPQQVAYAFFQAFADRDWEEVLKFYSATEVPFNLKVCYGGLEIISIGTPFQSGEYPGWFVPYEIKTWLGGLKQYNLAVRNDNPAGRYVVDGGF